MKKPESWLAWHVNDTLSDQENVRLSTWLENQDSAKQMLASVQQIERAAQAQSVQAPSQRVQARIMAQIQTPVPVRVNRWQWLWSVPVTLLLCALLWIVVQPGNQLQWTVQGGVPDTFRVYRAPAGSTEFELVDELPAVPTQQTYTYADPLILPGQRYQYRLEVVDQSGVTAARQSISSDTWMALAAQLAILLTSFMLVFGMIVIIRETRAPMLLLLK